jgi:lipase chaperone LimK
MKQMSLTIRIAIGALVIVALTVAGLSLKFFAGRSAQTYGQEQKPDGSATGLGRIFAALPGFSGWSARQEPAGNALSAAPRAGIITAPPQLTSLRGASVPDGLRVDANGRLIRDGNLQLLFDFFLAAQQDVGRDELHRIVTQWIHQRLNGEAAASAVDLWERYTGYQQALSENRGGGLPDTSKTELTQEFLDRFASVLQQQKELQQKWLPEVADNWFAEDNAHQQATLSDLKSHLANPDQATPKQSALPMPVVSHKANPAYEQRRIQINQADGLTETERQTQQDQLRRQYFPKREDYIRQSLRDLSQ